jgi:hypothetical protein
MPRHLYKPVLLCLALALLIGSSQAQRLLNRDREQLGLTNSKPLENAPPVLAFTTVALGGFRGIIANVLWVRAHQLQLDGKYFELIQLADWITKLQPRMAIVWRFQAWNLAYNVSVKFPDTSDRWPWVKRGIEMIRDEALRYNPHEIVLYQELGIIYQHKMGGNSDDAHMFYKYELAKMMEEVMGGPKPNYAELLDPQTEEAKARVRRMKEEFKLDPAIMKEVDDRYGPLEWRLPETHAIYWSVVGMKMTKQEDKLILRRAIYQSMQLAVQRGRMTVYEVEPGRSAIDYGPNIEMIPNANRVYEEMIEEQVKAVPEYERPGVREHMGTGHRNFLVRVVFDLYLHNRMSDAEYWYQYMARRYPFEVEGYRSLDQYVVGRFTEEMGYDRPDQIVANQARVKAIVEGLIAQYYHQLAIGEDDSVAIGRRNIAVRVWASHMEKIAKPELRNIYERLKLPPIRDIEEEMLRRVLGQMNATLGARLLTRLGRTAPVTNQVPQTITAPPPTPAQPKKEAQKKK